MATYTLFRSDCLGFPNVGTQRIRLGRVDEAAAGPVFQNHPCISHERQLYERKYCCSQVMVRSARFFRTLSLVALHRSFRLGDTDTL